VKSVLIDTSAFFGLLVKEHVHHPRCRELFSQAAGENWNLVITNMILVETYALLLNHTHQRRILAIQCLDWMQRVPIQIERVREEDERHAITLVREHEDKTYSLWSVDDSEAGQERAFGKVGLKKPKKKAHTRARNSGDTPP
jgi:predicted nucleic acid-binding protein